MNLDNWVLLTPDERNRLRREWNPHGGSWRDLLAQACERFQERYSGHPKINYITHSLIFSSSAEPDIHVTTALWAPQILEELPDRFETFAVRQEPIEDSKHYYLETWRIVLGNLLGWGADRVTAWAQQQWGDYLDGRHGSMFYHDEPSRYLASLLISELVPNSLEGLEYVTLIQRLDAAIGISPLSHSPYRPDEQRERVSAVLADYGVALPD